MTLIQEEYVLPPTTRYWRGLDDSVWTALSSWIFEADGNGSTARLLPEWERRWQNIPVTMEFTDAAGVRWRRGALGELTSEGVSPL
jgi:hypothetical protein